MTHMVLTLDPSHLVSLFFLFLTLLSLYKHPKIESIVDGFMNKYLFSEECINPHYHAPVVQTEEERSYKKDMQTDKWKYKLLDEDPLVVQLKKVRKSIIVFAGILMKITAFFEKLKNIITWHDPVRTLWFTALTFVAYCALAVLPFRFLFLVAVWANFVKGVSFYKKRYMHNLEISKRSLDFLTAKIAPMQHQQIMANFSSAWPPSLSFETFQKRMVRELSQRLRLNLTDDFLEKYRTPEDLAGALSTCSKFLQFKHEPREEQVVNIPQEVPPEDFGLKLIHFIMNVPSDYYRVLHPKGIELYTNWRNQVSQASDVFGEKISKRRLFETALIMGFFTLYEISLVYNFLRSKHYF